MKNVYKLRETLSPLVKKIMSLEKEDLLSVGRDVLVSLVIIGIILGSLYAFSGRWPPLVVIESGSMSHNQHQSQVGVIDPGDIVIVQENDNIVTYVEGRQTGYGKYGQYGDVIVFEPNGNGGRTPIIHRPVLYLEFNESSEKGSFDIPSLTGMEDELDWVISAEGRYHNVTDTVTIYDYGYDDVTVEIELDELLEYEQSGYITMGDSTDSNAPQYDQKNSFSRDSLRPVEEDWVIGKARGMLPWFGSLKLMYMGRTEEVPSNSWNNLIISMAVIFITPMILEIGSRYYYEEKKDDEENQSEEDEEVETEQSTRLGPKKEDIDEGKDGPLMETEVGDKTSEEKESE